jgi:glycine cleavage system H protein
MIKNEISCFLNFLCVTKKTKKMDGFSYNNIFETKGIEYIIIIAFLLLIIPFWLLINKQADIKKKIRNTLGILSAGILRIPQGIFYGDNHTWTHLERSGVAKVGLDDFLLHITGEVKVTSLKEAGNFINKGELLANIDHNGKLLQINSPISGRVTNINTRLSEQPGIINEDPYEKGWIYEIRPSEWIVETDSYHLADEAIAWSKNELERLKDFLADSTKKYSSENSMIVLQDGGELRDHPLSELPDKVWQDFQKSFLN